MFNKLLSLILNKYVHKVVKLLVNYIVSGKVAILLTSVGVTVDPIVLQGAVMAGIETGRGWVKQRTQWNWL